MKSRSRFQHETIAAGRKDSLTDRWVALILVTLVALFQAKQIWPALYIPWWFNTDEIFYFSEVIRFLGGDFHQTYYDIPGTPLMTLTALLMWCGWAITHVLGFTPLANPHDFAISNLQGMATLMRMETLVLAILSVQVSFFAVRRATNLLVAGGGAIATVTLPIFIQYSQFVRSESLGLVMCFGAWLLVQRSDPAKRGRAYLIAGAMCGVAMAARFHFALVGPPLLLVHWLSSGDSQQQSCEKPLVCRIWLCLLAFFLVGGLFTALVRSGVALPSVVSDAMLVTARDAQGQRPVDALAPADVLKATGTVTKLWYLLALGSAALLALRKLAPNNAAVSRAFHPLACAAFVGFSGGFLLSHPAFLWEGYHQLKSIAFYSAWDDAELAKLSLPAAWWKVTVYYFNAALPEIWLQILLGLGVVWAVLRRRSAWWPLFALVAVCFLAHPPRMKLWPHHIIPWLPALCAIAMLPLGELWTRIGPRLNRWRPVLLFFLLVAMILLMKPRMAQAASYYEVSRDRINFITQLDGWIAREVQAADTLLISYYSMGSDCFYLWLQNRGIEIPNFVKRNRQAEVWWLKKQSLRGRKGYIAVSSADITFFYEDFERKEPGANVNPLADSRFVEKAAFGAGFYEIKVLSFDFTHSAP
jgi:hypothetical protein